MWRYSKGKCALEVQSINSKSNQEVDFLLQMLYYPDKQYFG